MVEKELDAMIRRRDERRRIEEGDRAAEEMYEESCRRYAQRQREGLLWERLRFHEQLIVAHSRTFELLIGRHRSEVERLERLLGITETEGEAA
jgi:hypothetical protein